MKNSAKFSPKEEKRMKKYHFQENEKDFGSTVLEKMEKASAALGTVTSAGKICDIIGI